MFGRIAIRVLRVVAGSVLALACAFAPTPRAATIPSALGATDTVFVWTVDPYQFDPAYLARNFGCGVFDTRRARAMVLTGGELVSHPGGSFYSQSSATVVRAAGDAAWTAIDTAAPAAARLDEACAVYDSLDDAAWVFGGRHYERIPGSNYGWTTQVFGGLWRFDVGTLAWTFIAPVGPAPEPRTGASLVLDPVRRRLWLFGGADSLDVPLNDLWSMDVGTPGVWIRATPPGAVPSARLRHLAVYDPGADRMLVTAGTAGVTPLAETWAFPLAGTPAWQQLPVTGTAPAGRVVGAYDPARGHVLAVGNGDGAIYTLDLASGEWSAHTPFGAGEFASGSSAILDAANDVLISAWSGFAVVSGGAGYTPPTGFLHLGHLQPPVQLTAALTAANYVHGVTELLWDLQFDHPLWGPAKLEFLPPGGTPTTVASVVPAAPGVTSVGIYDASIAGDSLAMRFRWFDGTQQQVTADVPIRFPPAPLFLHVTPDTLWLTGSDLHVWFNVPDDSAQYLVDQTLERRDDGGPWQFRQRGFPRADGIWAFDEIGVLSFTTYEYRIAWTGPDGVTRASAPYGTTILGEPVFAGSTATADSVRIEWSTKAGIDELGRVLIQRPTSPGAWSDTIKVRTDPAGMMVLRDMLVSADADYVYRLQWFDGLAWSSAADVDIHTPGGPDTTQAVAGLWLGFARPNPATVSGFDLPLSAPGSSPTHIDVYDLSGRRRWSGLANAGTTLFHVETRGLGSGVYLVRAEHQGIVCTTRAAIVH
jgi:hypothetical protein